MNRLLLAIGVAALFTTASYAEKNVSGAYIGAGYGHTEYQDDDFVKEQLQRSGLEKTDTGYRIYGGYQFCRVIAAEFGYTDYGEFAASQDYSQAAKAISVSANVGYTFLASQLRPFALLGLGYVFLDHNNPPSDTTVLEESTIALHCGFGLQYEPAILKGFGLRLAYEKDIYSILVSQSPEDKTYTQDLRLIYLGLQYKF